MLVRAIGTSERLLPSSSITGGYGAAEERARLHERDGQPF